MSPTGYDEKAEAQRLIELQRAAKAAQRVLKGPNLATREVKDHIKGQGAGFFVRPDVPRLSSDGSTYCGNPIDGVGYYMVVSREAYSTRPFLKWSEVRNACAREGFEYADTPLVWERIVRGDRERAALVAEAVEDIAAQYAEKRVAISAQIERFIGGTAPRKKGEVRNAIATARIEQAQQALAAVPNLGAAWKEILRATATLAVQGGDGSWRVIAPGDHAVVRPPPKGSVVRVTIEDPQALAAMHAFFEKVVAPKMEANKQRVFASAQKPTGFIRVRARNNSSRRGTARSNSKKHGRGRGSRVAIEESQRVMELGPTIDPNAWSPVKAKVGSLAMKGIGVHPGVPKGPVRDMGKHRPTEKQRLDRLVEKTEQKALSSASRMLEHADLMGIPGDRTEDSPKASQPKAAPAMDRADLRFNYASVGPSGELMLWKRDTKVAKALAQLMRFLPFAKREFVFSGPSGTTLVDAIVQESKGSYLPSTISEAVAHLLVRSLMVTVDGELVDTPDLELDIGDTVIIGDEAKANSPLFSWSKSFLPPEDIEACLTRDEQDAMVRAKDYGFNVYKTYNPVLFEITRMFWRAGEKFWTGVLSQAKVLHDIDLVGRYGHAVSVAQLVLNHSEDMQGASSVAHSALYSQIQGKTLESFAHSSQLGAYFNLFWPLGAGFAGAKEAAREFVANPLYYARKLKAEVDVAVPRLVQMQQIGLLRPTARVREDADAVAKRALLLRALNLEGSELTPAEEVKRLKRFQKAPPRVRVRTKDGRFGTMQPRAVPATGEYDAPTMRLLHFVANAPPEPPRSRVPMLYGDEIPSTSLVRRTDAYLGTLANVIESIEQAIDALDVAKPNSRSRRRGAR